MKVHSAHPNIMFPTLAQGQRNVNNFSILCLVYYTYNNTQCSNGIL